MLRLFLTIAILLFSTAAWAADSTVDFGPVIKDAIIPLISSILLGLGGVLATWLAKKLADALNLKNEGQLRENLNVAITHGLAYAQSQIDAAADAGKMSTTVKSQVIKQALDYTLEHEKATADALGYDPVTLGEKIAAHLALNIVPPAQSAAIAGSAP